MSMAKAQALVKYVAIDKNSSLVDSVFMTTVRIVRVVIHEHALPDEFEEPEVPTLRLKLLSELRHSPNVRLVWNTGITMRTGDHYLYVDKMNPGVFWRIYSGVKPINGGM
jgi:hypothetical protein